MVEEEKIQVESNIHLLGRKYRSELRMRKGKELVMQEEVVVEEEGRQWEWSKQTQIEIMTIPCLLIMCVY